MRILFLFLVNLLAFWSATTYAANAQMTFKIRSLGPHQYEYSSVWNDVTQEATLRIGLVADKIDPILADKSFSLSSAKEAEFAVMDVPEMIQDCEMVSHWQFEYVPGLPNYLMYATLKGPGCQKAAEVLDFLQIRFRFSGVLLSPTESIDVAVDVSR